MPQNIFIAKMEVAIKKCNGFSYLLLALPIMWAGSIGLYSLAKAIIEIVTSDITPWLPPEIDSGSFLDIFGAIIISPVVETWIMKISLATPIKNKLTTSKVCIISSVVWGLFHGLMGALWFFGVVWHFYVLTYTYLIWEKRNGSGFSKTLILHMLNNSLVIGIISL